MITVTTFDTNIAAHAGKGESEDELSSYDDILPSVSVSVLGVLSNHPDRV